MIDLESVKTYAGWEIPIGRGSKKHRVFDFGQVVCGYDALLRIFAKARQPAKTEERSYGMHNKSFTAALVIVTICLIASCQKNNPSANKPQTKPSRIVRFELFTDADFSGQTDQITFTLHMANHVQTIFDSSLAPMRVEDIPDSMHRIIIERSVPGNDTSALAVGFLYAIENVGNSWYLDSFPAADTFKLIRYSFR